MRPRRCLAAALLVAIAASAGADEPPPLELRQALSQASQRPPEQLLADTRGLPYLLVVAPRHEYLGARDAARIETMARFFDVLLVDLDEAALSERMSTAYVAWDRMRARAPETSEVLRADSLYRALLSRRNAARLQQRLARSTLAIALGVPQKLPAELIQPPLVAGDEATIAEDDPAGVRARGPGAARRAHALSAAALELQWLVRDERPRVLAQSALAQRVLDEARARADAGEPADLGNAMAATVEAQRDELKVELAIALGRERHTALRGR